MVNETVMKYNTTSIDANSFTGLFQISNDFMNGGLGYGLVFTVWLISMASLSQYPNLDAVVSSTYLAWLTSIMFAVLGVVPTTFPAVLFFIVAGVTAYRQANPT